MAEDLEQHQDRSSNDAHQSMSTASSTSLLYPHHLFDGIDVAGGSRSSSHASVISETLVLSALAVEQIAQRPTPLQDAIDSIIQELITVYAAIEELRVWRQQISAQSYEKRKPWPDGMQRAFSRYKGLVTQIQSYRQAFEAALPGGLRRQASPEEPAERLDLALVWAHAALRAAEARVDFMRDYRDAYKLEGMDGHIRQAECHYESAVDALDDVLGNEKSQY